MIIIPTSYEDWKHCITVKCNIPLTSKYVHDRILALTDTSDYQTKRFIETWVELHYASTLSWFHQAAQELESTK